MLIDSLVGCVLTHRHGAHSASTLGTLMPNSAGRQLILHRRSLGGQGLASDVIPSLEDLLR